MEDCELAVALANGTEGAATATVLRITLNGAKSRVHGIAIIGRRLCAQVVERPGDSAAACTCDTQEVQGRERAEGKAHSVVIESG